MSEDFRGAMTDSEAADREPSETGDGAEGPESLEMLRAALDEQSSRYVRLAADFENFRRRKTQELGERLRFASEDAVRALLPVLDNLRRAVEHLPADGGARDGLELTLRQFDDALQGLGVTVIDTVGQPFDPAVHEAVAGIESGDVDRDMVIDELQRGYRLHDRVLRPAMVRVAHPAQHRAETA